MNTIATNNSMLLYLLLAVPLGTSLLAFACAWQGERARALVSKVNFAGSILLPLVAFVTIADVYDRGEIFAAGQWLYLDALGAIFLLVLAVLGFVTGLYSHGYMKLEVDHGEVSVKTLCHYFGFFHLFIFTILTVITTNNLILMWAGIEATTLASVFLVGIYGQKSSLEAAWKYIIICTVGVAFGLYGTVLVFSNASTVMAAQGLDTGNAIFWTGVMAHAQGLDHTLMYIAFAFVLVGFGTKAGLFPMHAWLPDAHSEAPSPVSALLSAVLLKCAMLVILRYYIIINRSMESTAPQTMLLVFGLISIIVAALFMVAQHSHKSRYANGHDMKRLLAYHSVEHMGIIALGIGFGGPLGVFAGLMHVINHSLAKGLVFCMSGNVLLKYGTRDMRTVKGMIRVMPLSAILLTCGALALGGMPPFSIFVSEFMIMMAGFSAGYGVLAALFALVLVIVLSGLLHMVGGCVFGKAPEQVSKGELGWLTVAPPALLLVLLVVMSTNLPQPVIRMLNQATSIVLDKDGTQAQVDPDLRALLRQAMSKVSAEEAVVQSTPSRQEK